MREDNGARLDPNSLSQIQHEAAAQLRVLFPHADPHFLHQAILVHLPGALPAPSSTSTGRRKQDPSIHVRGVVERVTEKLVDANHNIFPEVTWRKRGGALGQREEIRKTWEDVRTTGSSSREVLTEVDQTMVRNLALIRLHVMFPLVPITQLRTAILSHSHSILFQSVEQLLHESLRKPSSRPSSNPSPLTAWFQTVFTFSRRSADSKEKERKKTPVLTPGDLFRSDEYFDALAGRLRNEFPAVPGGVLRKEVEASGGYEDARARLQGWSAKPPKASLFFGWLSTGSRTSSMTPPPRDIHSDELDEEIWLAGTASRTASVDEDEKVARALNAQWTDPLQLFSCGCCWEDVPFEDIATCSATVEGNGKPHWFCRNCVQRQVQEHVYGGAPFMGDGEIRCLSTEGCQSSFGLPTLQRVLPSPLLRALERRVAERALEFMVAGSKRDGVQETVIQCPFCPYKEVEDGRIWRRAFPIVGWGPGRWYDKLGLVVLSLTSLLVLAPIYVLSTMVVSWAPDQFSEHFDKPFSMSRPPVPVAPSSPSLYPLLEPHRVVLVAHRYLTSLAKLVVVQRTGQRSVFQCRNGPSFSPRPPFGSLAPLASSHRELVEKVWGKEDECGKASCLICSKEWKEGTHRCFDEEDGLRLAIEKAMSEALKRTCPNCGVAFVKAEGCNKMTCRCGFIQCYCCRKRISDGYAHFCQHFREIIGMPCRQCTKCSLWQKEDEKAVVAEAASQARREWMETHPGANLSAVMYQPLRETRDRLDEVCKVGLDLILK